MRIDSSDNSGYVEISISQSNKVFITVGAKNANNLLETVINSAEITIKEFELLAFGILKTFMPQSQNKEISPEQKAEEKPRKQTKKKPRKKKENKNEQDSTNTTESKSS